jgi:hypothetical protein
VGEKRSFSTRSRILTVLKPLSPMRQKRTSLPAPSVFRVTTPSTALSGEKAARPRHCAATYAPHDSCGTDRADFLEELATSHTATSGFSGKL